MSTTQQLAGTYDDEAVEVLGTEDGRAQLFTDTWGTGNREPRVVHAVNCGGEVSSSLVSHDLHGSLAPLEQELETVAALAPKAESGVISAADMAESSDNDVAAVENACREEDLPIPEHSLPRRALEASGLGLLGIGDVYFTSIAFQVFGLSDRNFGVLPFNELQLVASSTIVAMLLCTRLAGHATCQVGHLMEKTRSGRSGPDVDECRMRRLCVRSWFAAGSAVVAVLGALAVLVGLSEVRASYLVQSGIDAHQSQFLLIQMGIAAAGFVLSLWMAHPYDREYRSATRRQSQASRELEKAYIGFATLVGTFNGLLQFRAGMLAQHRDWIVAILDDARRKGLLYARRVQLAQPEATDERLFPADLPAPRGALLVAEVNNYLAGLPTMFKAYEPLSMVRVQTRLEKLDVRREERRAGKASASFIDITPPRGRTRGGTGMNGNGKPR
jgi:hypothetical protein